MLRTLSWIVPLVVSLQLLAAVPGSAQASPVAPGAKKAPRLGLMGGVIFPVSEGYQDQGQLAAFRLFLRQQWGRTSLDMSIPFAGIAWSGPVGSSNGEARAIDWTIYDLFLARSVLSRHESVHIGVGLGLHRLHFTEDERPISWKAQSGSCGECGSGVDDMVLTGEVGAGGRLVHGSSADLTLSVRYRDMLVPMDAENEAHARGVLLELGAIF